MVHHRLTRLTLCFVALTAVLSMTSCATDEVPADFVWLIGAEPETIDPALVSGQPGGRIARNIFEGLVYNHPVDLTPQPGAATSWDISEDGLTYTFQLREAQWTDGTPVTAHDFVYAWKRVLNPATASKYANMLYPVDGAEAYNSGEAPDDSQLGIHAPDDHTLVVRLHSPCAYFIDLCCFYTTLPVPRHKVEEFGDRWIRPEHIAVNGPFILTEWYLNRRLRLEKNPAYWGADDVALNVVDCVPSDNINANFNLYMSGVADWGDASTVPQYVVPQLMERPDFHVSPYFATYFYRFNVNRKPFDDVRVRKALFLAMNREDIVQYVTKAGQKAAHSLVPPGLPGYEEVQLPERNIEEAKRLLAEAGYPDGKGWPKAEILFNTSENHKQIAEVLQQQWKEALGIHIDLVNQEWKVYLATTLAEDFWCARGSWIGDYLDPNTFLDMWTSDNGNNRTGWKNPDYDALIQEAARTVDVAERLKLLRRAEEWVTTEEMIILPMYTYVIQNLWDPRDFEGLEGNLLNLVNLRSVKPLRGHRGKPRAKRLTDADMAASESVAPTGSSD